MFIFIFSFVFSFFALTLFSWNPSISSEIFLLKPFHYFNYRQNYLLATSHASSLIYPLCDLCMTITIMKCDSNCDCWYAPSMVCIDSVANWLNGQQAGASLCPMLRPSLKDPPIPAWPYPELCTWMAVWAVSSPHTRDVLQHPPASNHLPGFVLHCHCFVLHPWPNPL